jgi:Transposase DDE domain
MGKTIRRLKRSVQKVAKAGGVSVEDAALVAQMVVTIARTGKVHLSEVARSILGRDEELIDAERAVSEQLASKRSTIDGMEAGWLRVAAPAAKQLPFIAVDGSEHAKPYAKAMEHLEFVRDASDPLKRIVHGYRTVQIDALDEQHRTLPLVSQVFSKNAPEFKSKQDTFLRAIMKVLVCLGREHTWLFDRGFDATDFLRALIRLRVHWVVRQMQTRNVLLSTGELVSMRLLAAGLRKPHALEVPYVDKSTHETQYALVSYGYAPVRLPAIDSSLTMIVVSGGRNEDVVLLTNARLMRPDEVAQVVLAYLRRWGSEESTRALKQLTGVEDFRVRKWESIKRLTTIAMITCGLQALMLLRQVRASSRYIARVPQFIEHVLLKNYRLWRGIQDALISSA